MLLLLISVVKTVQLTITIEKTLSNRIYGTTRGSYSLTGSSRQIDMSGQEVKMAEEQVSQ